LAKYKVKRYNSQNESVQCNEKGSEGNKLMALG